jgi:hypothetical protein
MVVLVALLAISGGAQGGRPGLVSNRSGARDNTLAVLTSVASTSLHLVADDWTGSGTWTDRSGSGNHASVAYGTPVKSTGANLGPYGRSRILLSTGGFSAPEITWSGTTKRTYEFVYENWDTTVNVLQMGTAAANRFYFQTAPAPPGGISLGLIDTTNAAIYLGAISAVSLANTTTNIARMFAVTVDVAAPSLKLYHNGVLIYTDTTTAGAWTPSALAFVIGKVGCGSGIVEIMRHEDVLDASTIAARAAAFNLVRGY